MAGARPDGTESADADRAGAGAGEQQAVRAGGGEGMDLLWNGRGRGDATMNLRLYHMQLGHWPARSKTLVIEPLKAILKHEARASSMGSPKLFISAADMLRITVRARVRGIPRALLDPGDGAKDRG